MNNGERTEDFREGSEGRIQGAPRPTHGQGVEDGRRQRSLTARSEEREALGPGGGLLNVGPAHPETDAPLTDTDSGSPLDAGSALSVHHIHDEALAR